MTMHRCTVRTGLILAGGALLFLAAGRGCVIPQANTPQYQAIAATDAQALIQNHANDPNFGIIDVRTPAEFAAGHIAGAANICVTCTDPTFSDAIAALEKTRTYFVYCGSQHRSPMAITAMQQAGFTSLYELTGGLATWTAAGLPVVQ